MTVTPGSHDPHSHLVCCPCKLLLEAVIYDMLHKKSERFLPSGHQFYYYITCTTNTPHVRPCDALTGMNSYTSDRVLAFSPLTNQIINVLA